MKESKPVSKKEKEIWPPLDDYSWIPHRQEGKDDDPHWGPRPRGAREE